MYNKNYMLNSNSYVLLFATISYAHNFLKSGFKCFAQLFQKLIQKLN